MKKLLCAFLVLSSSCFAKEQVDLLISKEEIAEKIAEVAAQINHEYQGEELTVIMVMKGAVYVATDLTKKITVPCSLEYVKASSYGKNGTQRGELTLQGVDFLDLTDKNILIIDDVFDSGHTMFSIINILKNKKPKSIKTLVLLIKQIPRTISYVPDYCLFTIGNEFVVGYGLDYKERYRGLEGIYTLSLE
ncbi:MAG: hypoxanthine phosphoribosyltransferase [Simkania sp.]|nr:hypoxanthine phosphoribosyltransferase [Simkania sp.]